MFETIVHFDIESTGLSITKDRIIQLSLIKTDLLLNILEKKKLLFNNDGVIISPEAIKAHGITEEMLIGQPLFKQLAQKIFDYLNQCDYIAGYNIKGFDIPLMYEEFYRCNLEWIPKPSIDSCRIFKIRESRTLSAAVKFYCGKELEGAHDAENDVIASIDVLGGQQFMYSINSCEDLVKESCYENEDKKLDFDGKIILREDGIPIWGNFGKNKGLPIKNDINYCNWVLNGDFSSNTKNVLKKLLS